MNNFQWTNQKVVYTFGASKELEPSSQGSVWLLLSLLLATAFVHALLSSAFPELPSKTAVQLKRQDVVYRRVVLGEREEEDDLPEEFKDERNRGKLSRDVRRGLRASAASSSSTARNTHRHGEHGSSEEPETPWEGITKLVFEPSTGEDYSVA